MVRTVKNRLTDRAVWFLVGSVIFGVLLVLLIVFNHDEEKPRSPQGVAAAAFNRIFSVKEWQPGMGKKPFMYHPAGFEKPAWQPLPTQSASPLNQPPGRGGATYGAPLNQRAWQSYGGGRP